MTDLLCNPTYLYIIIGVLFLAILIFGSGKGIGALIKPLLQKITGKSPVTVNVGGSVSEEFAERRGHSALTIDDMRLVLSELNHGQRSCMAHEGVSKDIGFVVDECKSIWLEIKEVNKRQMELRSKLPEQYVAKSDLIIIQDRLKSIDGKLDRYMELAVKNAR